MEKKIISFKGISNVPDDGLNEAGDMSVLLNMRHKGGELVPCQLPTPASVGVNISQVLYHANSGYWLMLDNEGNMRVYNSEWEVVASLGNKGVVATGVESFSLMGNIVIMQLANKVEYAIWRGGSFENLGELKDLFKINLSCSPKVYTLNTIEKYTTAFSGTKADTGWAYSESAFLDGLLDSAYQEGKFIDRTLVRVAYRLFDGSYIHSSGVYLVENSHTEELVEEKPIEGATLGKDADNLLSYQMEPGQESSSYKVAVLAFSLRVELEAIGENNKWRDIIQSVDVFCSPSIMGKKRIEEYFGTDKDDKKEMSGAKKAIRWVAKKDNELLDSIVDNELFYKYASYDLNGVQLSKIENTSPSMLAQEETLNVWNRHSLIAEKTSLYNSRLHVACKGNVLFKGYTDYQIKGGGQYDPTNVDFAVETTIETEDGIKKVCMRQDNYDLYHKGGLTFQLPGLLIYPDQRATKMAIYIKSGENILYREFPLTKHKLYDAAYYVERTTVKSEGEIVVASVRGRNAKVAYVTDVKKLIEKLKTGLKEDNVWTEEYGFYVLKPWQFGQLMIEKCDKDRVVIKQEQLNNFEGEGENYGVRFIPDGSYYFYSKWGDFSMEVRFKKTGGDIASVGEIIIGADYVDNDKELPNEKDAFENLGKNILKVSAVDNPFYFPTAQTYKFEGDIVGFASNAEAISAGQFGQYPLYVFTKEGIWAMAVDTSGQGAYLSQTPFSREVCNDAICPVSGGVVFSTDKGVMVISGGQVADLSAVLDGFEVDFFKYNAEMWNAIFAKANKKVVNPVPIREYIQGESGNVKGESGAKLAYNYLHNEIILSNKAKGYSYVYSLTNKVWSVVDMVFDLTTNKYPELVVFDKGDGKMYTFEDGAAKNKVVAITRPFTLGSFDFKRLRQAGLRTTFEGSLNFYLLGSNDGANFVCITGVESGKRKAESGNVEGESGEVKTYRDLITAMSRSKQYKYFAIAIAGQMSGRVSMAELLVDAGFANNKIR